MSNNDVVPKFVRLMSEHDCVRDWLFNRPYNTRKNYGSYLYKFCLFAKILPRQFQDMQRKEERRKMEEIENLTNSIHSNRELEFNFSPRVRASA